jgi:hypothetical protein
VPVKIDPNVIDEFRYTGLNNIDFIDSDFYKARGTIWDE